MGKAGKAETTDLLRIDLNDRLNLFLPNLCTENSWSMMSHNVCVQKIGDKLLARPNNPRKESLFVLDSMVEGLHSFNFLFYPVKGWKNASEVPIEEYARFLEFYS